MVAKCFALVYVAQVYLDDGAAQGADGVEQGDARVGIGAGVEHDARCALVVGLLQPVDEHALHVALGVVYRVIGIEAAQPGQAALHALGAVDARLAAAQPVQVGTVEDEDFHFQKGLV